jgi:hypothetical protein
MSVDPKRYRLVDQSIQGHANKYQCLGCLTHFCAKSGRARHQQQCLTRVQVNVHDPACTHLAEANRQAELAFGVCNDVTARNEQTGRQHAPGGLTEAMPETLPVHDFNQALDPEGPATSCLELMPVSFVC